MGHILLFFVFVSLGPLAHANENEPRLSNECKITAKTHEEMKALISGLYLEQVLSVLTSGDYQKTTFGNFEFNTNCSKDLSIELMAKDLQNALKQGLSCMVQLGGVEAKRAVGKAQQRLKDEIPVQIDCKKDNPRNAHFEATAEPPFKIHVFPDRIKKEVGTPEVLAGFFHEYIHTLGYKHGSGFELAESCDICCFDTGSSEDLKSKACDLCKSSETDSYSEAYARKLLSFYRTRGHQYDQDYLVGFLMRNPTNEWAVKEFTNSQFLKDSPSIRNGFISVFKSRFPKIEFKDSGMVSKEFQKLLTNLGEAFFAQTLEDIERNIAVLSTDKIPLSTTKGEKIGYFHLKLVLTEQYIKKVDELSSGPKSKEIRTKVEKLKGDTLWFYDLLLR